MNVTKSCNQTFSWQRHGQVSEDMELEIIRKTVETNCMKSCSDFNFPDFFKDKIVLDAGSGGGLKSNSIAQLGAKLVIGVDGSGPAIEAARALSRRLNLKNTLFIKGFLENVELLLQEHGIEKVDYIINAQVIHHTTKWKQIIRSFSNLLKTNGILTIVWVDPTLRKGLSFLIKNQIAFRLGRNDESRLRIGKALFGNIDKKYNIQNVAEDSFYADRYSAYYRWILLGKMIKVLNENWFQVLEAYPYQNVFEWIRQRSYLREDSKRNKSNSLLKIFYNVPFTASLLTFFLRFRHLIGTGGTERVLICRKTGK